MNLHEFQAKTLFKNYNIPVPAGYVIHEIEQLNEILNDTDKRPLVVKAQVHAGGRGKAGGVKLLSDDEEIKSYIDSLLGARLITHQTDAQGQLINHVLIESACAINRELYLGIVIDRSLQRTVLIASTEGGVNIEEVAANTPEKIIKIIIDPMLGIMPYQIRQLAFQLELSAKTLAPVINGLVQLFIEKDLSLIEVNPLVETVDKDLLCLDAKINIDDNALFRQADLLALRDKSQEDPREIEAAEWDLNYVALEGNIGCMVNGAGLAMATMDIIKLHGGEPANFLDVGGSATAERVSEAFKLILSDTNVKGILINIFGGIVRCDLIAQGIIEAVKQVDIHVPVVVRFEGNHAQEGSELLKSSGLNLISASDLTTSAKAIIEAIK